MNKNIAIVVGIILIGAVLYATGVFAQPWEEPIEPSADIIEGSWKHEITVEYIDGTTEIISGDNILGKILYNDNEVENLYYSLSVIPINPTGYDYTEVEMKFPDPNMARLSLECIGGDAYDAGIRSIFANSGLVLTKSSIGAPLILSDMDWRTKYMEVVNDVGGAIITNAFLEASAGYDYIGYNGEYALIISFVGDDNIEFRILTESPDTYYVDAPTSEFTINFEVERDHNVGGITFDWDPTGTGT